MHILIAENDTLHRSFLKQILEEALPGGNTLSEVTDGEAAIEAIAESAPEAVVLDLQMPRATGVDVAKYLWSSRPDTRILFWSNYADEAYIRGINLIVPPEGIYGYVLKSSSEESLRLAILSVFMEGQCVVDREVRGIQRRTRNRSEGLTETEYEVLVDLSLGLTDKAIAARRNISLRGAQNRLQILYEKLGLDQFQIVSDKGIPSFNTRSRAISVAFSRGLLNSDALIREEKDLNEWLLKSGHATEEQ